MPIAAGPRGNCRRYPPVVTARRSSSVAAAMSGSNPLAANHVQKIPTARPKSKKNGLGEE